MNRQKRTNNFELGNSENQFDSITERQIERLYDLLSPNAVIDLRMSYGLEDQEHEKIIQSLANKLRCKIRAYSGEIQFSKHNFTDFFDPKSSDFSYSAGGKTFYPK